MTNAVVQANNQIAAKDANVAPGLTYTREQIELIKRTVAKGATDDELKMFIHLAKTYDLDPFLKEIWFIKRVKKVRDSKGNWDYPRLENGEIDYSNAETVIMTSRDGYLKAAQRDPDFQGLISFAVREGDVFEIDAENYKVTHKFGAKRGAILGAWAKCDRKGRMPSICYVDFKEYFTPNSSVWKQYPSAMIQKVAEVFVLRRQFNINGLVAQEEMRMRDSEIEMEQEPITTFTPKPDDIIPSKAQGEQAEDKLEPEPEQGAESTAPKQQKKSRLLAAMEFTGMKINEVKEISARAFGKRDLRKLTKAEQDQLLRYMQQIHSDEITLEDIGDDIGKEQKNEQDAPDNQNGESNGKSELTDKQLKRLYTLAKAAQVPAEEAKRLMETMYGITSSRQLTREQYDEMCMMFEQQAQESVPFE